MVKRNRKRLAWLVFAGCLGVTVINGETLYLLSGEHPLPEFVFGSEAWSLFGSWRILVFVGGINVVFIGSYASFFWMRRIPTSDEISKIILYVFFYTSLLGLILAFTRIGLPSRSVLVAITLETVLIIFIVETVFSRFDPITLIDYADSSFSSRSIRGIKIISSEEWNSRNKNSTAVAVDGVIVGNRTDITDTTLNTVIQTGVEIFDIEQLREQILGQIEINEDLISRLPSFNDHTGYLIVRRVIDIFASFLFLPVGLILVVIVGVLIKLETNGPVFFVQKRIGRSGKPFLLFKLRTMVPDEQGSASFASQNVHRITRIGRIARRWRIDEIPQLWNIFVGDMSLIGPRPEQQKFVEQYEAEIPFYNIRHRLRPGLTGWAQVKQGYAEGREEARRKLSFDIYYLRHVSPWLDGLIVLKTLYFIAKGG